MSRRLRLSAALGLAVFLLPSCFTTILWQGSAAPEQAMAHAAATHILLDAESQPCGFLVHLEAAVAESSPWPAQSGDCWVAMRIDPRSRSSFEALLARRTADPAVLTRLSAHVHGVRYPPVEASIEAGGYDLRATVEVVAAAATAPAAAGLACEVTYPAFHPLPLGVRVLLTPFVFVGDVLAFPLLLPVTLPLAMELGMTDY